MVNDDSDVLTLVWCSGRRFEWLLREVGGEGWQDWYAGRSHDIGRKIGSPKKEGSLTRGWEMDKSMYPPISQLLRRQRRGDGDTNFKIDRKSPIAFDERAEPSKKSTLKCFPGDKDCCVGKGEKDYDTDVRGDKVLRGKIFFSFFLLFSRLLFFFFSNWDCVYLRSDL